MYSITKYSRLLIVGVLALLLDQITKFWVLSNIEPQTYISPPPIPIIDNFLYLVHIYNTGAAWGSFSGSSFWFGVLAIVVLISIFIFRKKLELERPIMQYIMGLLIGGILGNLIDRFYHGHVIDFIDVHLPGYRWPAFNVADMSICISVGLYIILGVLDSIKNKSS